MGATGDVPSPALGPPSPCMSPAPPACTAAPIWGIWAGSRPRAPNPSSYTEKAQHLLGCSQHPAHPGHGHAGSPSCPPRATEAAREHSRSLAEQTCPSAAWLRVRLTSFLSSIAMGTSHNHPYIRGAGASPPAAPAPPAGGCGAQGWHPGVQGRRGGEVTGGLSQLNGDT